MGEMTIRPTIIWPFQACQWLAVKKNVSVEILPESPHLCVIELQTLPMENILFLGINDASTSSAQVVSYIDQPVANISKEGLTSKAWKSAHGKGILNYYYFFEFRNE